MTRMANATIRALATVALSAALGGCYGLRRSDGGGQARFTPPRELRPQDIAVPSGYMVERVASGLTFPSAAVFDDKGRLHVVEAGYSRGEAWATPRLLRLEPNDQWSVVAAGERNGPWTGADFRDGYFFIAEGGQLEGGRILKIDLDGKVSRLVEGLPSQGDHHTNGPALGPDGFVYFGQGSATNSGVVGTDNELFGWVDRAPAHRDIPCRELELAGLNFAHPDKGATGAFSPLGAATRAGQKILGRLPCNGAILRIKPGGGPLELVAWGLRNPYGLAFSPDGRLFATEHGYDERGSRPVWGAGDHLWAISSGTWYGWPDYSGGKPLADRRLSPGGRAVAALLSREPGRPPRPAAEFAVHASASGLDFSRSEAFGHVGEAFVAEFGDLAPLSGKLLGPVGFKVVRVQLETGAVEDFAVNRGRTNGPASLLRSGGLERPIALRFSPDGSALYIVDFGVVTAHKEGIKPYKGTGAVWRIRRRT